MYAVAFHIFSTNGELATINIQQWSNNSPIVTCHCCMFLFVCENTDVVYDCVCNFQRAQQFSMPSQIPMKTLLPQIPLVEEIMHSLFAYAINANQDTVQICTVPKFPTYSPTIISIKFGMIIIINVII